MPDKINLIKSNGTKIENISANVEPNSVFFNDKKLPIEVGDIIERVLPNQLREKFKVLNLDFHSTPYPHYRATVLNMSSLTSQQTTYIPIINPAIQDSANKSMKQEEGINKIGFFERYKTIIEGIIVGIVLLAIGIILKHFFGLPI